MTSDSDGLEEVVRENLKLRGELAAEVAKAKVVSQRGGFAYSVPDRNNDCTKECNDR